MEPLYEERLTEHHRQAQRARGAHHPEKLPDLLACDEYKPIPPNSSQQINPQDGAGARSSAAGPRQTESGQTQFEGLGT